MKIDLKINRDTIGVIAKVLYVVTESKQSINDKMVNVYRSIGFDLYDKFERKKISFVRNQTLFDTKKKHKISLKFHEAWALEMILIDFRTTLLDEYDRTLFNQFLDMLNQKLA